MFLSRINLNPFYAPATDTDEGKVHTKSVDDIISFLDEDTEEETIDLKDDKKDDDKKKEEIKDKNKETDEEVEEDKKKDEDKDKDDKDDEEDDLSEFEDELEEPSDEDLELEEDVPTRREILKAYPDLFKKFPQLEKSYFRERQFTKFFANPKDAEETIQKAETLDKFGEDLMNGDITKTLTAVKNYGGEKAFYKLVDNYLETLQKVDKDAHQHLFSNVIKHTIGHMVSRARRSNDEDLMKLAEGLNKFIFNSDEYEPPSKLSKEDKDDGSDKLTKQQQELFQSRFDEAKTEVSNRVSNILRGTIKVNIDKKEEMTEFVRRSAIREAMDTVENLINKDTRLRALIDKLWDSAAKDNFSRKSLDKIKDAFSSRAKTLLPSVIKKARTDALRGIAKKKAKVENDKDDIEDTQDKEKPNSKSKGKKPEDLRGIDTLSYLMEED